MSIRIPPADPSGLVTVAFANIEFGQGGWVRFWRSAVDRPTFDEWLESELWPVYVRFGVNETDELQIVSLYVPAGPPTDAKSYARMVDIDYFLAEGRARRSRIECRTVGPNMDALIAEFASAFGGQALAVGQLTTEPRPGVESRTSRFVGATSWQAWQYFEQVKHPDAEHWKRARKPPVPKPNEGRTVRKIQVKLDGAHDQAVKPADFYAKVAEIYLALLAHGERSPNAVIADHNGVEKTTADRWIRTARDDNHKHLGKTSRGKAG